MTEGDSGVHAATIRRILAPPLVLVASAQTHARRARQLPTDEGHAVARPRPAKIRVYQGEPSSQYARDAATFQRRRPTPPQHGKRNSARDAPTMSFTQRLTGHSISGEGLVPSGPTTPAARATSPAPVGLGNYRQALIVLPMLGPAGCRRSQRLWPAPAILLSDLPALPAPPRKLTWA